MNYKVSHSPSWRPNYLLWGPCKCAEGQTIPERMQSQCISQCGSSPSSWEFCLSEGQDSGEIFEIPPSPFLPQPILHHRALVCPSSQQSRNKSRATLLFNQESLAVEEISPDDAHRARQVQTWKAGWAWGETTSKKTSVHWQATTACQIQPRVAPWSYETGTPKPFLIFQKKLNIWNFMWNFQTSKHYVS